MKSIIKKLRVFHYNRKVYAHRWIVLICMIALLGGMTGETVMTAYASGTQTTKKTSKVEIGKKTSASAYIKSKNWPKGPAVEAGSAVLMEAETGTVLYAKNPDTKLYPASITKIMTALLTLENHELTETVTCTGEALAALPPNYVTLPIEEGEKLTVEDCLGGLLLYSANDVANALAVHHSGSIEQFAKLMNERAKEAGAKNTHFNNPSGLHEKNHYTTAYDMCRIMRECIQIDTFNQIAGIRAYTLKPDNKRKTEQTVYAKHDMLFPTKNNYYKYCVSGKTGYTDDARNTLVTYAEKDGMKLICCVMKCGKGIQYADTRKLFDYGFDHFKVADVSASDDRFTLKDAGIFASEDMDSSASFNIEMPEKSFVVLPSGVGLSKVDTDIRYLKDAQDGCFAEIDYLYQNTLVGSARLKMSNGEVGNTEHFDFESHAQKETEEELKNDSDNKLEDIWNRTRNIDVRIVIALAAVIVVIVAVIVIKAIRRKDDRIHFDKRNRRRR